MNKRQVIVLWAIALLLVVALIAVKSTRQDGFQSATERSRGDTLLSEFEPAEVAKLEISNGDNSATAVKKDGNWVIANRDDYPADAAAINELLRKFDEVKVIEGIEADPSFAPRFGMDPKATEDNEKGTEVVLLNDAGTELARLTFGKNSEGESNPMNPMGGGGANGRYVKNAADTSGIYKTSELFPTLSADASAWLDEDFVKVTRIKSVTVSEAGKPDSTAWKLSREDGSKDFVLEGKKDDEEINSSALSAYKNLFSYARFEDVVPAADAEKEWQADQKQTATIETFDGFTYTVDFAPVKDDAESYLMTISVDAKIAAEREKPEGEKEEDAKQADETFAADKKALEEKLAAEKKLEGRTFKVAKYTVDSLLKKRADFIQEATSTPSASTSPQGSMPPSFNPGQTRPRTQAVTPPIAIPPAAEE
ncbi:DUF4340 domain-containing protein [Haloferula chungangensis]|uniref:DUF4340 domain-containing protein n=1 Tax=Haloferula chungangensis TaxID=1048331 RepID=A0ABW2L2U9_9BACT